MQPTLNDSSVTAPGERTSTPSQRPRSEWRAPAPVNGAGAVALLTPGAERSKGLTAGAEVRLWLPELPWLRRGSASKFSDSQLPARTPQCRELGDSLPPGRRWWRELRHNRQRQARRGSAERGTRFPADARAIGLRDSEPERRVKPDRDGIPRLARSARLPQGAPCRPPPGQEKRHLKWNRRRILQRAEDRQPAQPWPRCR